MSNQYFQYKGFYTFSNELILIRIKVHVINAFLKVFAAEIQYYRNNSDSSLFAYTQQSNKWWYQKFCNERKCKIYRKSSRLNKLKCFHTILLSKRLFIFNVYNQLPTTNRRQSQIRVIPYQHSLLKLYQYMYKRLHLNIFFKSVMVSSTWLK